MLKLIEIFLFHICVLQGGRGFKIGVLQRARRTDNGVEGGCGEKRKIISYFSQMIQIFPQFDIFLPFFSQRKKEEKDMAVQTDLYNVEEVAYDANDDDDD